MAPARTSPLIAGIAGLAAGVLAGLAMYNFSRWLSDSDADAAARSLWQGLTVGFVVGVAVAARLTGRWPQRR